MTVGRSYKKPARPVSSINIPGLVERLFRGSSSILADVGAEVGAEDPRILLASVAVTPEVPAEEVVVDPVRPHWLST